MNDFKKLQKLFYLAILLTLVNACKSDAIDSGEVLLTCDVPNIPNEAGTSCIAPPPISCAAPTVPNESNDACIVGFNESLPLPVYFPNDNEAVLYYNRADVDADNSANDSAYEGWRLHTWNNENCDAYADADAAWADGRVHNGIDPTYGAYWILSLKEDYGDCQNFIIHIGTDEAGKEMGGGDFSASLIQDDERFSRMNFTISGEALVFEYPIDSLGEQAVTIEGAQAHWLDPQTLLWSVDFNEVSYVKLHYSENAELEITLEEGVINSTEIELSETSLSEAQGLIAPHLAELPAFMGNWSNEDAKAVLKNQVILGAYNSDDKLVGATRIQHAKVLDQLYTIAENDADEAQLGPIYNSEGIKSSVWAPTAQDVKLNIYNADKTLNQSITMLYDNNTGIWSYQGDASLDRQLYRFEVSVYSPVNDEIETLLVTDPYSVSLSTNGRFSQFVNLQDEDLKPDGWDTHNIPTIENFEDAVIYEGHIRDFSIRDQSISEDNRGKYLAFTELESLPMLHLSRLAEKGLTHFHILPANDIATIDEDESKNVDWNSPLSELCALAPSSSICSNGTDTSQTIAQVYASFDTLSEPGKAQEFNEQLRNYDLFNWGYDPKHFNTPDGSYASDPEGSTRILEMRSMIQSLHEIGLRTVLDVVYNHTNASGLFANSVFDKIVPGYYHRYTIDSGDIVRETCCDDTEPRNRMMEKFMHDSLLLWAQEYKFDSFRFDIMSQASKTSMENLFTAVQAIDVDTYFYGEGWGKDTQTYGDFETADQINMAGTEIGTYNDRIREAIRRGNIFASESNDAALSDQDILKMSMAGTLTDFVLQTASGVDAQTSTLGGYAQDPADIINYISKHDNETLWDQFNYTLESTLSLNERVRAQNLAHGITLLSQGIPFIHMGSDFLRSKSMDRNSYDSGDWFNYVDFTFNTNNWNVGLPPAQDNSAQWSTISQVMNDPERLATYTELEFASSVFQEFLSIRSNSGLFRLTSAEAIKLRVGFHNLGARQQQGLIAMSIDDGVNENQTTLDDIDPNYDAIMVIVNTGYEEKSITVATAELFELHPYQQSSIDSIVSTASFIDASENDSIAGTFTVPPLSAAVFVKPQGSEQGYGLSAQATIGAPDVVPFGDTSVYLRGSLNNWSEDNPFSYIGDGIYQVAVQLEGGQSTEFKVASSDWASVNLGNSDDGLVLEDSLKDLFDGGGNLQFVPSVSATFIFTLDASDTTTPSLYIENEEPYVGLPIYVRGDMNGWSTANELIYEGSRIYTLSLNLEAQQYQFKIANAEWDQVNFGAYTDQEADAKVVLGSPQLLLDNGANLYIDIEEAGQYQFVFDSSVAGEPTISVYAEQFFNDIAAYIRGSLNGWGTDNPLVWQDDGYYTNISVEAGAYEFKVASEDWASINLGGAELTSLTTNEAFSLSAGDNPPNLMIDFASAGTYQFKVSRSALEGIIITVSPNE